MSVVVATAPDRSYRTVVNALYSRRAAPGSGDSTNEVPIGSEAFSPRTVPLVIPRTMEFGLAPPCAVREGWDESLSMGRDRGPSSLMNEQSRPMDGHRNTSERTA